MARKPISDSKPDVRAQFPLEACMFAIPEASNMLRLSKSNIYLLIKSGQLKSVLVGRRRLVPGVALQDYIRKLSANAA